MAFNDLMDEQRAEKNSEFNFSISTLNRINNSLILKTDYFRIRDYMQAFEELKNVFDDLSPFTTELKSDGLIEKKKSYTQAKELEIKCQNLIDKSYINNEDGDIIFQPTRDIITAIRNYEEYLKAIMMKHKIYMKMSDNLLAAAKT